MIKLNEISNSKINEIKSKINDNIEDIVKEVSKYDNLRLFGISSSTDLYSIIYDKFEHKSGIKLYITLSYWYHKSNGNNKNWKLLAQTINENDILKSYFTINERLPLNKANDTLITNLREFMEKVEEDLSKFSYESLTEDTKNHIKHKLSYDVCPYCNRNYTSQYFLNGKERITAELDHFYPKKIFPLLSLSLFNFIISCPSCNRNKNSRFDLDYIYPYSDDKKYCFNFKINFNDDAKFLQIIKYDPDSINVSVNSNDFQTKKTLDLFHIEEIYKTSNNKYISTLLKKLELFSDESILNSIKILLEDSIDGVNVDKYINLLLTNSYKNEINCNQSLSKLTYDVINYNKELYSWKKR